MENENYDSYRNSNVAGVLAGLLIGGLAGATTMLLLAPQSGKRTRMQLQQKGIELREQTVEMFDDAVAQVSSESRKLGKEGRTKAKQLIHKGQTLIADQLDQVTAAVKSGKKTIQGKLTA